MTTKELQQTKPPEFGINIVIMSTSSSAIEPRAIRTSKLRWLILLLFSLYSMSNVFPWIHYSILATIVKDYYGVSVNAITWTGMIYMVLYIPLVFPATWLLGKVGLRVAVLLGSFGTALGAWIKCASVAPDRFVVTMVGQTVVAVSQVFVLSIPPKLAAVWFGPKEVSTACAIGVLGNQVGMALGFLIPRELVKVSGANNSTQTEEIEKGLNYLFYGTAVFSTLLFVVIVFVFKAAPSNPPSLAAVAAGKMEANYLQSIARLVKNRNYCLLLVSYGINVGVFYALSIVLDQIYAIYFPHDTNSGRVGLTFVVGGMVGSVVTGFVLDKTHKFKEISLALYILAFAGMVAFTFVFRLRQIWLVFVTAFLFGFTITGYLPVGFEFAAEITYPESEGTSSGLLSASADVFALVFTELASVLLIKSDVVANLFFCACLLVGVVLTAFIKADLKRQAAQECHTSSKNELGGQINPSFELGALQRSATSVFQTTVY